VCGCGRSTVRDLLDGDTRGVAQAPGPSTQDPAPSSSGVPDVTLMYVGGHGLLLKGPVSRRIYPLRPGKPVDVDTRDAVPFLNSPLFTRLST
jgi:hypothetical protein